jgi:hypothetical protein
MKRILVVLICFLFSGKIFSEKAEIVFFDSINSIAGTEKFTFYYNELHHKKPNPILLLFKKKLNRNRKITAALLAFPFPFGIVGLHRIFLGTKPYVPVVYIASLGGIFGLLPLIDFFVLMFDKDLEHYNNNGKVFMWIR